MARANQNIMSSFETSPNRDLVETALIGFVFFVALIMMIVIDQVLTTTYTPIKQMANQTGVGGKVNPILDNVLKSAEIAFLILMFVVPLINYFIIAPHREEHETYEYY